MHHEIRPSLWNSIYFDDWEIEMVIINKNWVRRTISFEEFYQDIVRGSTKIECRDVTSCYRIIHAEKKWNLLEIELWDSTLRHRK